MVDAHHEGASTCVVVDEVELPKRTRGIEGGRGELANPALQLALSTPAGKSGRPDVIGDVEGFRLLPP